MTHPPLQSHGRDVLRTPDGAFMRLAPEATPAQLDAALAQRARRRRPHPAVITVHGDAPQLFTPVVAALTPLTTPTGDADEPTPLAVALHAVTGPADEDLADADLAAGSAVIRVHREDDVLFVHPLADPADPHAVSAHDLRARRLAASPAADLLSQLWQDRGGDPLTDLPPTAAHLAVARILQHALHYLHRQPHRGPHLLHRIEMTPLRVDDHPVLRVPELHTPPRPRS
ncbi:hypothetical protein KEM60_01714 [Austwickia sp. TVS 96-490-7B]|nr:hypothetical protein [Austwickia sp. TVS 96-490-7B]